MPDSIQVGKAHEVKPQLIDNEKVKKVQKRVLIGKSKGAKNFVMRLFTVEEGGTVLSTVIRGVTRFISYRGMRRLSHRKENNRHRRAAMFSFPPMRFTSSRIAEKVTSSLSVLFQIRPTRNRILIHKEVI